MEAPEKPSKDKLMIPYLDFTRTPMAPPPTRVSSVRINASVSDRESLWSEIQHSLKENLERERVRLCGSVSLKTPSVAESIDESSMDSAQLKEEELKAQRAECRRYAGFEKFAAGFVNNVMDTTFSVMEPYMSFSFGEEQSRSKSYEGSQDSSFELSGSSRPWPKIEDFTREAGQEAIEDYISTWDYHEDWLYCIEFIIEQSDECSDYYTYEVKWSIPTNSYPIPQATASVYFIVDVSRIKPKYCGVDVCYMFEGARCLHSVGKNTFRESFLFQIIDAKLKLFKRLRF